MMFFSLSKQRKRPHLVSSANEALTLHYSAITDVYLHETTKVGIDYIDVFSLILWDLVNELLLVSCLR